MAWKALEIYVSMPWKVGYIRFNKCARIWLPKCCLVYHTQFRAAYSYAFGSQSESEGPYASKKMRMHRGVRWWLVFFLDRTSHTEWLIPSQRFHRDWLIGVWGPKELASFFFTLGSLLDIKSVGKICGLLLGLIVFKGLTWNSNRPPC